LQEHTQGGTFLQKLAIMWSYVSPEWLQDWHCRP